MEEEEEGEEEKGNQRSEFPSSNLGKSLSFSKGFVEGNVLVMRDSNDEMKLS